MIWSLDSSAYHNNNNNNNSNNNNNNNNNKLKQKLDPTNTMCTKTLTKKHSAKQTSEKTCKVIFQVQTSRHPLTHGFLFLSVTCDPPNQPSTSSRKCLSHRLIGVGKDGCPEHPNVISAPWTNAPITFQSPNNPCKRFMPPVR